jgi:hypothetical protein
VKDLNVIFFMGEYNGIFVIVASLNYRTCDD